jgi:hypothetical protein
MHTMPMVVLGLAIATVVVPAAARADDVPVLGRKLRVSDPLPGKNPHQRQISVIGRDRIGAEITGNPKASGATVELFASGGASSANQAFVVPGGAFQEPNGPGWSGSSRCRRTRCRISYTYVDERGENGSIVGLRIRSYVGRWTRIHVRADGRGNNPTITVTPPNPGERGGAIITIPDGSRLCVLFGGTLGGRIAENDAEQFVIVGARSSACPPGP